MSRPAAPNAVRGNNPMDYRRKIGFFNTKKIHTKNQYYEETDSEIVAYVRSKTLSSKDYKEGSTANKRSKHKTLSNYYNPKAYNGQRKLIPIKNTKDILQKTGPTGWILCDKNAIPKSQIQKIIHIQPQAKHELLHQQPTQ
jgi:hypothetical protein